VRNNTADIVIIFLFYLLGIIPCISAEELNVPTSINHLFSLDLGYSLTGFTNSGWGAGLNYEQKLLDYLSVKGGIGHMTFQTDIDDVYCTSVNVSLFAAYYPFAGGLDKLYTSVGCNADFMNYFGSGTLNNGTDDYEDTLISIIPVTGWKWHILKHLMIDMRVGYKFIIQDAANYANIKKYVNEGLQFGIGFNILW
jgi:hypothetical protein